MLKSVLGFVALGLLVDAMAFGGFYREHFILGCVDLVHSVLSYDWRGFTR